MNWIDNFVRPKIRSFLNTKRDTPENLWVKDPESGEMVFYRDLEANQWVVPNSGYHMKIKPTDRLRENRAKTGFDDSVIVATGKLFERDITVAIQDFDFMGGSLGMAAGQGIITGLETAANRKTAFVLFVASGGARMQEGALSLMQMAKTTVALERLAARRLPYISVLTDPTTGGVTASFATLGDVIFAEPKALVSFAGPRVIQQTIRQDLPEGFQRSEFLLQKGMIDDVVHRRELKTRVADVLRALMAGLQEPTTEAVRAAAV